MTAAAAPRGLRLSTEARGMLPWCIVLSASVHVLLLTVMAPAGPRLGGLAARVAGHAARPIGVRLLVEAATSRNETSPTGAALDAGVPLAPAVAADAASAASAASAVLSASGPAASASAAASAPTPVQTADSPAIAATATPGDAVDGGYIPRPLLSVAPDALAPVVIAPPPETADVAGRHVGVLALYIDEQGRVRRIDAEQPALPEAMERAAREAFMAARFSPGQVDGHVVRSRLRVEVVFDDEPAPAASNVAAASAASAARAASSASAAGSAGARRSP